MQKTKKHGRFRKLMIISAALAVGLGAVFLFYFYRTEAPITEGKVILRKTFKENLKLDIYLPTGGELEKSPTVLFIHGGAWIAGTNRSLNFNRFNHAINELRSEGFTIVSPEYTLAKKGQSPFPNCIEDVYAAAHWIQENAEQYNFDLNRFGVFGESAGAHLALMLAYASPDDFDLEISVPKVKYVVDVYGPTDLYALYHSSMVDSLNQFLDKLPEHLSKRLDLSRRLFGFDPKLDTLRARRFTRQYSPIGYLNPSGPPTLVIHGENDKLVPLEQSRELTDQLKALDMAYEFYTLPAVNHGFIGANKEQKDLIQRRIYEFIMKYN